MVTNLTEGKVNSVLWKFTLPMFISVVFQQFYNMADSAIAGKFAGEEALAAVGASYPVTMIFMAIAVGSNVGCSVVISRYFGGGWMRKMKTAVSTTILASLVLSIFLTGIGLVVSGPLLHVMNTPANIFDQGKLYLNIYIAGLVFLFLYNVSIIGKVIKNNECPHVPKLAKFKPPRCPIGVYWNTLCLMRDVWTIKTYMI